MFIRKMRPSRHILIAGAVLLVMLTVMSLFSFADEPEAVEAAEAGIVETAAEETAEPAEEAEEEAPKSRMFGTFWSLVPPLIAIVLALITKEVYSSLFIGVLAGGLFAADFSFSGTLDALINDGFITAVSDNAGIFLFLVILGVVRKMGREEHQDPRRRAARHLRSRRADIHRRLFQLPYRRLGHAAGHRLAQDLAR